MFVQIINMKARGLEFLTIPASYYEQLREKLKSAKITVTQDLNTVGGERNEYSAIFTPLPPPLIHNLYTHTHTHTLTRFSLPTHSNFTHTHTQKLG